MRILPAVLATATLLGCASGPRPDPTPSNPAIGCIVATLNQQATVQGKLLPEPVRIIGEYDGDQWMVIRGVYSARDCIDVWDRERCRWMPMDKRLIKTAGCGMEASALREMGR